MNTKFQIFGRDPSPYLIGLFVFLFHLWHVPAVTRGAIFRKSNLAFDFDIDRFVQLWCTSPFPVSQNANDYAVRHPLAVSLRLVCWPLVQAGLDAHIVACSIAAACVALSAALIYTVSVSLGVQRWTCWVLAALWSVSTTTLVLGVLPEAYGMSLPALTLQFLLAIRWLQNRPPTLTARIVVAVTNFGITLTNAALVGLTEFICRLAREPAAIALRRTFVFGVYAGVVALALTAASFYLWPTPGINGPLQAAKQVYWSAAGYDPAQKQDPANVAWEFGATSFVAPAAAHFPSGVPTNPYLWDLRGQNYSPLGWAAVLGWFGLLVYGIVEAAKDRERWALWAIAALWAAGNIALHSFWQYRGSVFVYAANSYPAFFLLAVAGARRPFNRQIYGALLVVETVLVALNNLPLYLQLPVLN